MSEPDRPATGDAAAGTPEAPTSATDPGPTPSAAPGTDLDRRRFFRQFASDVFHTAATVVGAASALQRTSIDAASAILNGADAAAAGAAAVAVPPGSGTPSPAALAEAASRPIGQPGPAVGYRSAFRIDGERLILVDQRRLPFALLEVEARSAIDVANELATGALHGGPVVGQVAAVGLAMSAARIRASRPYARRAILRAAETTLLTAAPWSRHLRAAVERVMGRYRAVGELEEDGDRIADAIQAEADAILFEAADDHGRIADAASPRIPRRADRSAGVLTLGVTGAMGGGQFGTATGAVQAAVYADRDVQVFVLEGRPSLAGARVTSWELREAGIAHTLLPDAAAGWLLQSGRVDLVLIGAEAIARNGDVANDAGTYPLAALAGRHNVPVVVAAPLAAVDPEAADGRGLVTGERRAYEVTHVGQEAITLTETPVLSPVLDVTPAGLITAFATEEGLIERAFARGLEAALASRARRLPGSLAGATIIGGATDGTADG